MAKTFDEKREAFQRMRDARLGKALKAIELLGNLARKSGYEYLSSEVLEMLDQLDSAVDTVADAFGCKTEVETNEEPVAEPVSLAEFSRLGGYDGHVAAVAGGAEGVDLDQRAEIRWAFDALKRGDKKLAINRLERVLQVWQKEA